MKRILFAFSMVLIFGLPSMSMAGGPKETGVVSHWGAAISRMFPLVWAALARTARGESRLASVWAI